MQSVQAQRKAEQEKQALKEKPKSVAGDKSAKLLLGELFPDREYLEKLLNDECMSWLTWIVAKRILEYLLHAHTGVVGRNTRSGTKIREMCIDGINYLDTRTEFWRQQKPMYARNRDRDLRNKRAASRGAGTSSKFVLKSLEEIDEGRCIY